MDTVHWLLPLLGFAGGAVLGLAARLGKFCTLSAMEDAIFGGGLLRMRMWGLAIAVAIAGTALASGAFGFDGAETFYLTAPVPLASTVLGGLLFGIGMALVGTCGYGALARLGGGDLSGLVVFLVIGLTGYIASNGFLAEWRIAVLPPQPALLAESGIAHALSAATGASPAIWAALAAMGLAVLCLTGAELRRNPSALFWALAVGAVIVGGWMASAWGQQASFGETTMRSYSFVRPLGDAMFFLMTSSSGDSVGFASASVAGVLAGACAGALLRREFRWEACDDAPTLKRQIVGAAAMGIGGVFALGCTVGQGLSAASVLAVSAPVALLSMFFGAWLGLQWLVRGSVIEGLRDLLERR